MSETCWKQQKTKEKVDSYIFNLCAKQFCFSCCLFICCVLLCTKAKLVQATYVSSIIQSLPQRNGVIDVSLACDWIRYWSCCGCFYVVYLWKKCDEHAKYHAASAV